MNSNYSFKIISSEELREFRLQNNQQVFSDIFNVDLRSILSDREKDLLNGNYKNLYNEVYTLNVGVFDQNNMMVGWHVGYQSDQATFYMMNSGILENHRRKGLYSDLLNFVIDHLSSKGFQVIYSRHTATNNAVIIPKLKAGFIISSLELDDIFGTLVHLRYYFNKTRRKIMDVRSGQKKPDEELKQLFNI